MLDDGCGLPETSREAWLENRRCFLGGAGLGLLLCRECCRRMGWDLQVEQRAPEKGTRAVVTIPLCDEPMPEPTVELRSDCSPVRTQQQYQLRNMLVRELRTMPERGGTEDLWGTGAEACSIKIGRRYCCMGERLCSSFCLQTELQMPPFQSGQVHKMFNFLRGKYYFFRVK